MNVAFLNAAVALLTLEALALALLGLLSWRRSRRARQAWLAGGFALFAGSGAATAYGLFHGAAAVDLLAWQSAGCAAGLALLYLAAVKR
ncbi:MAG: hypothetical protein ACYDBQ_11670 [Thermoplasmatota archaeon]